MPRIGIVGFSHETNSFALEQNAPDDILWQRGEQILAEAHPRSFIGGFAEAARQPGVELVPCVAVGFRHGGTIQAATFERCRDAIVEALASAGPLDGVYFALHGAMAPAEPYLDGEGELLAAVRARPGLEKPPFVATYDFHAIMSAREMRLLDAAAPNNTNPHVDGYERGQEAADLLLRTLRGEIRPVTRHVPVPIIGPNIGQSTWSQVPADEPRLPLYQLNQRRAELEQSTPGLLNLTILGGYGYADTPDASMAIVATTDTDPALAERVAADLARELWAMREDIRTLRPVFGVDEGVRLAMARPDGPIVLVDLGDDPGSACPADSPVVLESLLRLGARDAALTIRDAPAVEAAMQAGVGSELTLDLGASIDRRFYAPVRVTATVRSLDDGVYPICGPTHGGWGREVTREAFREARVGPRAVLRLPNNIDVICSSTAETGKDRDFFKSAGTVFESKHLLVVKSNQAHRASFDPVSAGNVELATPGPSTVDYASLPFRHLRRPMWPIDRDFDWQPPAEPTGPASGRARG